MGGQGSGNFGHSGRPDQVGGSGEGGGSKITPKIVYQHSESSVTIPNHEKVCKYDLEYPLPLGTNKFSGNTMVHTDSKGEVRPGPHTEEAAAMGWWKGTGFEVIEAYNKNPDALFEPDREKAAEAVKVMDEVLSKSEIEQDVTVYRGINGLTAHGLDEKGEFKNPNFTSTTLAPGTAMGFAQHSPYNPDNVVSYQPGGMIPSHAEIQNLMMFTVPKGSNGFYWDSENEVLLPRGLSLKVTGVTEFQKGITMKRFTEDGRLMHATYETPIRVYTMEMKK